VVGKQKGSAKTVSGTVTEALWKDHIEGKQGLGIIPVTEDGTCYFGAIDIDDYEVSVRAILNIILHNNYPLHCTASKSGGLHVWRFYEQPMLAAKVIDELRAYAGKLGYADAEVFPKQTSVDVENGRIGNWINMPFFGTTRYGYDAECQVRPFKEWYPLIGYKGTKPVEVDYLFDAPPCIRALAEQGIQEGHRNDALFAISVYLKKKYGSVEGLAEVNNRYCNPKLNSPELSKIKMSCSNKDYKYACKSYLLQPLCDAARCVTTPYGVGNNEEEQRPIINGLKKMLTTPPVWILEIGGKEISVDTETLQNQQKFQRACMEELNIMPPVIKQSIWREMLFSLLQNVEEIEVPYEATEEGRIYDLLEQYCTQNMQAASIKEISRGKPYTTKTGTTYFTLKGFMEFLNRLHMNYTARTLSSHMRRIGIKHGGVKSVDGYITGWYHSFLNEDEPIEMIPDFDGEEIL
jgi:hypothetical protein